MVKTGQIVIASEQVTLTRLRNVCIAVWRHTPVAGQIKAVHRLADELEARYPRKTALANVVIGGRPSFPEEVRKEALALMGADGLFNLGTAHVILIDSFGGATTRAFLSSLILLARPKEPNKVFAHLDPALTWLAQSLMRTPEHGWSREALASAVGDAMSGAAD